MYVNNKESLWTKNFIIIFMINFFVALVYNVLNVTIAPYAIETFHVSTSVAGLTASIFLIGSLLSRMISGPIIDGAKGKKVLILALAFNVIIPAMYFGTVNLLFLLIIRVLHGFVFGIATIAAAAMNAQIHPYERRGEGIGYFSMNVVLAQGIGPSIGIPLSHHVNFRFIFICAILFSAISLALAIAFRQPSHEAYDEIEAANNDNQSSGILEYNAVPIALVALVAGLGYSILGPFLSIYAEYSNLVKAFSLFFPVYSITVLASRLFSGRMLDTKGASVVLYPALFLFALGMFLYSRAGGSLMVLLAGVLIGFGFGNFHSCAQAVAVKSSPSNRSGAALSTYFLFYEAGTGVGPYLFGALIPFLGWNNSYLIAAIVILTGIGLYYFLLGRKEVKDNAIG